MKLFKYIYIDRERKKKKKKKKKRNNLKNLKFIRLIII